MRKPVDKAAFIEENGFYVNTPSGNSMWPFIRGEKDQIEVRAVKDKYAMRKYDVILYSRSSGENVLHRIVGKKEEKYLVRGDHCYYTEKVDPSRIMGKLCKIYKNGEKQIETDRRSYRLKVRLWNFIYPFRYLIHGIFAVIKKLTRRKPVKKS